MQLFRTLNEIIFPSRCIGCSVLGPALCRKCGSEWRPQELERRIQGKLNLNLKVYSNSFYGSVAQRILLSAKESHVKAADELLVEALTRPIERFLREEWIDALIPIPSRPSVARKRGRQFLSDLTYECAENLGLISYPLISHARSVKDQSGLDLSHRWNNLEGALVVTSRDQLPASARVLLIDDLVTTGATLLEAARALKYAGIEVIGGVTACVAKPLR
jgi:predicted amidophosphoribosyltransferase